jgi:hypothetical protein
MEQRGKYVYFKNTKEFAEWLKHKKITRLIKRIQHHHTYSPSYDNWYKNPNAWHFHEAMRKYHMGIRGWVDIAQHVSTFPDGSLIIGRDLNRSPAGIYDTNTTSICIENVGNFDKDDMTNEQKQCIIDVTSLLCIKLDLIPHLQSIIYHHWFSYNSTKKYSTLSCGFYNVYKTCPGIKFFKGNKPDDCHKNFIPLVEKRMKEYQGIEIIDYKKLYENINNKLNKQNNDFNEKNKKYIDSYNKLLSKYNLISEEKRILTIENNKLKQDNRIWLAIKSLFNNIIKYIK